MTGPRTYPPGVTGWVDTEQVPGYGDHLAAIVDPGAAGLSSSDQQWSRRARLRDPR